MSLSLPGFIQNFSWAVVRVETLWFREPLMAREFGCKSLLFLTQLAVLCGQTTVCGLTLNNYLAVSHPISFKRWMTPRKTFACVACVWVVWSLVNVSNVLTLAGSDKPCLPLVIASKYILLIEALVILLTTVTVASLNLRMVIQFWGKFKVHPVSSEMNGSVRNPDPPTDYLESPSVAAEKSQGSTVFSIAEEVSCVSPAKTSLASSNLTDTKSCKKMKRRFFSGLCVQLQLKKPEQPSGPDSNKTKLEKQVRFNAVSPEHLPGRPPRLAVRPRGRRGRAQSRVRKMAVTLVVLTVWNSIGYLPFMVCLILAVADRDDDVLTEDFKALSDIGGTIIRVATIGNTFIYAWRFIGWKSVCSSMKSRCVCCRRM